MSPHFLRPNPKSKPRDEPTPEWLVIAAWAAPASGPGWANSPILVLRLRAGTNKYRVDYIQPEDQTPEMRCLYGPSAAMHKAMKKAVEAMPREEGGS